SRSRERRIRSCALGLRRRDWRPFPQPSGAMPETLLFALLKGIAVGVVIALPAGPVGVLCVRRTFFQGATYGFVSGLGAAAADTVFGIFAGIFAKVGVSGGAGFLDIGTLVAGVFLGSLLWWLGLSFGIAGFRRVIGT